MNLTSINANYVLNFQDCSVGGPSSFLLSSNQTYTAYHSNWGQPSAFEYYWYVKYDNNGSWQDLGQGPKEYSFTPIHSSFELKCYLKDKFFNIGVWSPIKRVEYTPLVVTVNGPTAFSSKMLLTYTANHEEAGSGLNYDWWIKYDFNNTWQRLGGGLKTKSIMSTADPAYSFYIKCYVKTASDTIGVCSNDLRAEYYSFGDPVLASKDSDDKTLNSRTAGDQESFGSVSTQAVEPWWPVNADELTLRQKIQILLPIRETIKELTHKFRWKETDAFEAFDNESFFENLEIDLDNDQELVTKSAGNSQKNAQVTPIGELSKMKLSELDKTASIPTDFAINQNYPNPFNPSTTITFEIAKPSLVKLTIFNTLGQSVRNLYEGTKSVGRYDVVWDGKNDQGIQVPSGMYIYRLEAGDFTQSKKMMLVK